MKVEKYESLGKAIFKWFMSARSISIHLSVLVVQEKATHVVKMFSIAEFKASDRWVNRWKARNNVTFKIVPGEAKSYLSEMTAHWKQTHLSTTLPRYILQDIFNAYKFGLFFQTELWSYKVQNALVVNTAKYESLE